MDPSGSQKEKRPVPRFASFKAPPGPPPQADRRTRETADRDEKSRHRSSHRSGRERSRSRERRRERRDHRHSHRKDDHVSGGIRTEPSPVPRAVVKESANEDTDLYVVDLKGDKYNLVYGTIHRYSIPRYYRYGRGSVLGLPPSYKIDRESADGDALVIRRDAWRTDAKTTKAKSILRGLDKQRTRLLRVRPQSSSQAAIDASEDFLPLSTSTKQKPKAGSAEYGSDDERHAYRSIHGKAKPEDDMPSDLEAVSDRGSSDEYGLRADLDEEVKRLNAELTRNIAQNPSNVDAWVRLIEHQDSLLRGAEKESRPLTYAERQSLADIKISLYDKALKKVGPTASKDRLLLGRLEEGAKLWDTKKLSAQWETVLKTHSQYINLWVKYLDFRQTEFLHFTYDRCLATFMDCLRLNRSSQDGPEKAQVQNYLFLRLTSFIREAGFTEQAVGLWQAILEWTYFHPDELHPGNDQDRVLSAFTEFWESEVARIGEATAKGWKSGSSGVIEPRIFTPTSGINAKHIFPSWATCERERIINARLPARSLDESEDDDPYRVIIPSDLQDSLSLFWKIDSRDMLIESFLYFCHLPPLMSPDNADTTGSWSGDNFLRNDFIGYSDHILNGWLELNTEGTPAFSPISFPLQNFIHTADTFFAEPQTWFSSFVPWTNAILSGLSDIDPDWTRRTLRSLVEANPRNEDLAEYTLAVEFARNRKEAKKYAKSLLKKRSSSLRLYNAYALIERRSGNHAASDHVWSTSISMSQSFAENDRVDCGLLWRAWIWEALGSQNLALASHLLLSMPQHSVDPKAFPEASSQTHFSPANLLKVQRFLSDAQENTLATRKGNVFVAYTECLALLPYLSQSLDLNKCLGVFSSAISRLSTLPVQAERFKSFTTSLLHQARSKLLYHHIQTSGVYKPSHIRTLLTESISLFPHNTIFLSLFAWNESRFRIDERVRDVIRDITTKPRTEPNTTTTQKVPVTSHLFSIYTELARPVYAGSTTHSVRAAFEKAIGDPSSQRNKNNSPNSATSLSTARSNLSLWKLYIVFELSRHGILRAKDVFYRAMRACPWSKELIMMAFTHLRADVIRERYRDANTDVKGAGMGFDELHRVYNVLVEKELRIHVDIEDMLDDMQMQQARPGVEGKGPIDMPVDKDSEDEEMRDQ